jgi:hypothetical protein
VSIRKILSVAHLAAPTLAVPAFAEDWGVGASLGIVNDVEKRFRLDDFDPSDFNGWVDFRLEPQVVLRGTIGRMETSGDNAGRIVEIDGDEFVLPELDVRIDYATIGASYLFWEGDYTSGIFGGIGGYKVNPEPTSEDITDLRDFHETVFGWHIGLDGDIRVLARLSIVGRITFHKIRSESGRSLLTANAGAVYRF